MSRPRDRVQAGDRHATGYIAAEYYSRLKSALRGRKSGRCGGAKRKKSATIVGRRSLGGPRLKEPVGASQRSPEQSADSHTSISTLAVKE
jgi:hypothetical protein